MSKLRSLVVFLLLIQTSAIAYYSADFIGSKLGGGGLPSYNEYNRDAVNVLSIQKTTFVGNTVIYGRVKSAFSSIVNSPVINGYKTTVEKIYFKTGEKVEKDDLLVLFSCPGLEFKLEAAKKEYQQQDVIVEAMKKKENFVSKAELLKTYLQLEKLKAEYNSIGATCDSLRVRAPFGGTVSMSDLVEGEIVSQERVITQIINNELLEAEFFVDSSVIENIKVGMSVIVETSDGEYAANAIISDINPSIDEFISKTKVRAKLVLDEQSEKVFKHNMTVNVSVEKLPIDNLYVVPRSSVIEEGSSNYVCKVDRKNGLYETRLVRVNIVDSKGEKYAIYSQALHDGDYIIYEGFIKRDGVSVFVKEIID